MSKTVYSAEHEHLVRVLTAARKDAGLKQSELAERLGRDPSVISTIETGQRRVDVLEFLTIARALNLDPVNLFARFVKDLPGGDDGPTSLPDAAPELYENRKDRSENPVEFMNRVWGPWLPRLYQDQLRKLDPKLIPAIKSFCQARKIDAKTVLPPGKTVRLKGGAK